MVVNMVRPHSEEHRVLSQTAGIIYNQENWLEDALHMDVYSSKSVRLRHMVDQFYDEIALTIKIQSRKRTRDALKTVLINLWFGWFMGKAVRYSRDRSAYSGNARYGRLFFKYDRLLPVIDALESLKYIEQKQGVFIFDKEFGYQTRMWSRPQLRQHFYTNKLKAPDFFHVSRPEELIILRDESKYKREVGYREIPLTRRQREDLESYNEFLDQHEITVSLDGSVQVNYRFFTETLYQNILNNSVQVQSVILSPRLHRPKRPFVQWYCNKPFHSVSTTTNHLPYHLLLSTMTQMILPDALIFLGFKQTDLSAEMLTDYLADLSLSIAAMTEPGSNKKSKAATAILEDSFPLSEIGIERLTFRLGYEYLHRVYNRKSFELGGRAYGALHQRIPKYLRPFIQIDGQPTVELDFSAYHILMLYHMEGIDYQDDPYEVCEGPEMRATYKAVALVSINAKDDRSAYGAIREELEDRGIPLPAREKPLVSLVNTFRDAHKPIAKYLFSDIGLKLQKEDSDIMNSILMRLMDRGILGLSVYDSVIVADQYRDILYETMIEEYEAAMGFKPRL
jgi:hypothetical protein